MSCRDRTLASCGLSSSSSFGCAFLSLFNSQIDRPGFENENGCACESFRSDPAELTFDQSFKSGIA